MPDFSIELAHGRNQGAIIAGVDEVGRGPLAGPVIAAAVIWPDAMAAHEFFARIKDSKKLTAKQRTSIVGFIQTESIWALGTASVAEIDGMNILQASLAAMQRAIEGLATTPSHLLLDGNQRIKQLKTPQTCVIGGDDKSLSIAAAAIIAKVTRDELMATLDHDFPGYGWATNAGYGSAAHMRALAELGPTIHHRTSFAPVREALAARAA